MPSENPVMVANEITKAWKVVRPSGRKLRSVVMKDKPCGLRYVKGKWTRPKIKDSKIFVFDNLSDACDFAVSRFDSRIYECDALNAAPLKAGCCEQPEMFWEWWRNASQEDQACPCACRIPAPCMLGWSQSPAGTLGCDAVRITRKVFKGTIFRCRDPEDGTLKWASSKERA